MERERWSIALAARTIDVVEEHLRNVLRGITRPMPEVRDRLPKLLGLPLDELFTADVLAKPYDPTPRCAWKSARS
ncbi:hypothetical protein KBX71_12050 [Micromonospora sp. D93]|uniref:hypothetical protein n=1 Tax=Micromonospora sp. D93 TaxID=2824886 RepID=UPI001B38B8BE|nr:hypothetical protein [Micromonospora sp. D93]MBQ1018589.1 hypothetical protein [Micromonospora sp. D93]